MKTQPRGLGAYDSIFDKRTLIHNTTITVPLITGGTQYASGDIEDQWGVGICTAISLIQNAEKVLTKKFSPDFQYLLQKKFYDLDWEEGSSILSALKVGKNYGFLPLELFTWVTEQDRKLPYAQYIAKLQAIPTSEIARLMSLCTNKLAGYAQLPLDSQSLAKGIMDSQAGILTRYDVTDEWWTAISGVESYAPADIDPIRHAHPIIDGHAIGTSYFNFTSDQLLEHPNTWGVTYDMQGKCHTIHSLYPCTEAWIPYYGVIPTTSLPYQFTQDFSYGSTSEDVKQLQLRLGVTPTGYFGMLTLIALYKFQIVHRIFSFTATCGIADRNILNQGV